MKKTLLVMLFAAYFILNFSTVNAQGKCKFYVDKTDPITGKHHRATNVLIKSMGMYSAVTAWAIEFDKMGDDYSINSKIVLNTNSNEYVEIGDSLMLKLESGKVITLYAKTRVAPKALNKPHEDPMTSYISVYTISIDDFKLLASDKIFYVRINVGSLVFDQEVKDKAYIKLQNAAICILQ